MHKTGLSDVSDLLGVVLPVFRTHGVVGVVPQVGELALLAALFFVWPQFFVLRLLLFGLGCGFLVVLGLELLSPRDERPSGSGHEFVGEVGYPEVN